MQHSAQTCTTTAGKLPNMQKPPNHGRGRPPKAEAAKRKAERLERRAQVVDLKCQGISERTIAKRLGVDRAVVRSDWAAYLEDLHPIHEREAARATMREQLHGLLESSLLDAQKLRTAVTKDGMPGDPEAAARIRIGVVRILDRLAKLDGLDEPARVEVSGDAVGLDGVLAAIAVVRGEVPEDSSS